MRRPRPRPSRRRSERHSRRAEARTCAWRYGCGGTVARWIPGETGEPSMPDDISGPNRFARDLFGPLPARYDRLAEILSFGQNGRWRSAMVGKVLAADGDRGQEADG